jgi:antitoxin YefM
MTAVSISHAREHLFPLVRQVNDDHIVVEIVARNIGNAVLMSAEDYESLQETLHLFSTRANATHILRGLEEARDGRAQPVDLDELAARFRGPATAAKEATAEAKA